MPHPTAPTRFRDRSDAGQRLAVALDRAGVTADVVLAIPRGGLSVAAPIATACGAPLDVLVARKVGAPMQQELAIGAVTRFGVTWNKDLLAAMHLPDDVLDVARDRAMDELKRSEDNLRAVRPAEPVEGRRVVLVDDGLATGATMAAAVAAVQHADAAELVVAAPVASDEAVQRIEALGAQVVTLSVPAGFGAVGSFYDDFSPVGDEECVEILSRAGPGVERPPTASAR